MNKIIIIGGPTASNKSSLAIKMSKEKPSIIINADSLQIYKNNKILSAQPSEQDKLQVSHKLYGFADDDYNFSVGKWLEEVVNLIKSAFTQNLRPIIVGGTGMYISSLVQGLAYVPDIEDNTIKQAEELHSLLGTDDFFTKFLELDPVMGKRLHKCDTQRLIRAYSVMKQTGKSLDYWQSLGNKSSFPLEQFEYHVSNIDRDILYSNCNQRFDLMMKFGGLEEAYELYKKNLCQDARILRTLGIKELFEYFKGNINLDDATRIAKLKIRQFAKRQVTWFKNQLKILPRSSSSYYQ